VPDFVSQECADHAAAEDAERHALGLDKVTVYTEHAGEHLDPVAVAKLTAWQAENPAPRATLQQVADHVEHAREVAGVSHIGLGGDFDGVSDLPIGLEDVSAYPTLLTELAGRGWSDSDLEGLTSGNILRVLQAAEDTADVTFGA